MEHKKAFISYSWDSANHQEWVLNFANQLRKKGIDAEVDLFEIQLKSTHLYQMMVNKIRDSDFIILVLTEKYAGKADKSAGGVGFESRLMLPLLIGNPDKLIYIVRHEGAFEKVFPFQLKGQHAIDFSDESEFNEKLEELVYRIYGQRIYHKEPLGPIPEFNTRKSIRNKEEPKEETRVEKVAPEADFFNIELPNLKRITDRDIDLFLKESFKEITSLFNSFFNQIQAANTAFEFDKDDINIYETIFKLYVDGRNVNTIKIWYGSMFGGNTINLSYGNYVSSSNNSANEIIRHHIDDKKQLSLKMDMNMYGNNGPMSPKEVVREIWKNNISHTIK